jgi:hypothetical protein
MGLSKESLAKKMFSLKSMTKLEDLTVSMVKQLCSFSYRRVKTSFLCHWGFGTTVIKHFTPQRKKF